MPPCVCSASSLPLTLRLDGTVVGWGENYHGQTSPPAGNQFTRIAAGDEHALALREDGSIAGWGADNLGQATPPAGNDYVDIAAGNGHSLALKADGSIVGWGHDADGTRLEVAARHSGVNSNVLTDASVIDPLSGNAVLNGIPVTITAS